MTSYLNEDEQVEALKSWWKENGKSIVIGLVLGFSAIFGWQGWQSYRVAQGEAASNLFTSMQNQAAAGDVEGALSTAQRLLGEFTGSAYASFAALKSAQLRYAREDRDGVAENLSWVVSNAPDDLIADLARIRLARLEIERDDRARAGELLNAVDPGFMPATVAELRGDIALAEGDRDAAREAYVTALAVAGDDGGTLQMKLLEIGIPEKAL